MRTPTRETPFKLAYESEAVIPTEVHMANHRVMTYQDKDNEEQLRLNLNLIDVVRTEMQSIGQQGTKTSWLGSMMQW